MSIRVDIDCLFSPNFTQTSLWARLSRPQCYQHHNAKEKQTASLVATFRCCCVLLFFLSFSCHRQILPDLEALRRLAVSRIQEFFVSIFTEIRQAEAEQGAQMMLQNSLQKHTVSFKFPHSCRRWSISSVLHALVLVRSSTLACVLVLYH